MIEKARGKKLFVIGEKTEVRSQRTEDSKENREKRIEEMEER